MTDPPAIKETIKRAEQLRFLHRGSGLLVLANVWDAASARAVEAAGFPAVATTSGGVAQALGYGDHERAPAEEMIAAARRIISAVGVPVSVDFEAGYRLSPADIARRLIAIGAAGMNLEDTYHHGDQPHLTEPEAHAAWLSDVKAAARREGVDLVLNARVDVFIHRQGTPEEQLSDALGRARLYVEAGADCIYPILLADEVMIAEMIRAVEIVNVMTYRGGPLSLERAATLGVRRVSYATSIFREAAAAVEQIMADIYDTAAALSGS